jgi:hypothetical protein
VLHVGCCEESFHPSHVTKLRVLVKQQNTLPPISVARNKCATLKKTPESCAFGDKIDRGSPNPYNMSSYRVPAPKLASCSQVAENDMVRSSV